MLTTNNISKRYGDNMVLDQVGFTVADGERVGVVGPNGCGKSTLLRIIAGLESASSGSVMRTPSDLKLGYLPQGWDGPIDTSVAGLLRASHPGAAMLDELAELEQRMAAPGLARDELAALLDTYAAAQQRFEALGGYAWEYHAAVVRAGLGLVDLPAQQLVAQLSGGQKTRLALARLLLAQPDLLLLDEPTNHLDGQAIAWLEHFLSEYHGAALIVSHDRAFLDRVATRILELRRYDVDRPTPQVRSYTGGYGDYAQAQVSEQERQWAQWKDQQAYVAKVAEDIRRVKQQGQVNPHSPAAKKAGKKAKARERKLERYLDSSTRTDKPRQTWGMKLDFEPPEGGARVVLRVERLSFAYTAEGTTAGEERACVTPALLRELSFELTFGERAALIGPNGVGKSTLLKLIAGQLQPCGGHAQLGAGVQLGYMAQEHETLDLHKTVLDTLLAAVPWDAAECRRFLHRYLFTGDDVFRPVRACSSGERARLSLAVLVARGCTFLVLDEPINHLDIPSRERFEAALDTFAGTILAVAHDRYFLTRFARRVLELRSDTLVDYPGGYEDYVLDQPSQAA